MIASSQFTQNSAGYSHWGLTTGGGNPEPNNIGGGAVEEDCVVAEGVGIYYKTYSYLQDDGSGSPQNTASNYIVDATSSSNVAMWNDYPCTGQNTYPVVCETTGRRQQQGSMQKCSRPGQRPMAPSL